MAPFGFTLLPHHHTLQFHKGRISPNVMQELLLMAQELWCSCGFFIYDLELVFDFLDNRLSLEVTSEKLSLKAWTDRKCIENSQKMSDKECCFSNFN